jgi:hypothetical protein
MRFSKFVFIVGGILAFSLIGSISSRSEDMVRIGVIIPRTGRMGDYGNRIEAMYEEILKEVRKGGGLQFKSTRRRLEFIFKDSGSQPAISYRAAQWLIEKDKVSAIICFSMACASYQTSVPLLLIAPDSRITRHLSQTFLIVSPSYKDVVIQSELAVRALIAVFHQISEPRADDITQGLRNLNMSSPIGSVRFDNLGNNIGLVPFPYRGFGGPNAAGCTSSCGSSCPSNCGKIACEKNGGDQCCSLCGEPLPP